MSAATLAPRRKPERWDYTQLAATYDLRADYCPGLIEDVLVALNIRRDEPALDVGAGTGKLTIALREFGLDVTAIEPNERMRSAALAKAALAGTRWIAARGEALPIAARTMRLVSYGSSFNAVVPGEALDECARVLRRGGHWLALWNHRDLADPLQREIEARLHRHLPDFDYGTRRESPAAAAGAHAAFADIRAHERRFVVRLRAADWIRAWHSHATLRRQAGVRFDAILVEFEALVAGSEFIDVPYFTRAWSALRT